MGWEVCLCLGSHSRVEVSLQQCSVPFYCSEFYEVNALMMEEEGAIIAGLLVGLNVIDANFCMKGEDLDSQVWETLRTMGSLGALFFAWNA